jgi:transposase
VSADINAAPTGSVGAESRSRGPLSGALPWREAILQKLEQGLSGQRIYQDLIDPAAGHGYTGSYYSIRRLVQKLTASIELPMRRMECAPGAEAQVDFGQGAPLLTAEGKRKKSWVFRIVLSHSRKGYSESVGHQTTDEFIRCLENAFAHFGGIPQTLVIDNLRAAVSRADWFDPELCPKVRSFAEHYGIAILPTRPRTPRHKGKVENGVKYVKANALKGMKFASLAEENRHLWNWESSVADTRIHGTTRRQVIKLFMEIEKPALLALPAGGAMRHAVAVGLEHHRLILIHQARPLDAGIEPVVGQRQRRCLLQLEVRPDRQRLMRDNAVSLSHAERQELPVQVRHVIRPGHWRAGAALQRKHRPLHVALFLALGGHAEERIEPVMRRQRCIRRIQGTIPAAKNRDRHGLGIVPPHFARHMLEELKRRLHPLQDGFGPLRGQCDEEGAIAERPDSAEHIDRPAALGEVDLHLAKVKLHPPARNVIDPHEGLARR